MFRPDNVDNRSQVQPPQPQVESPKPALTEQELKDRYEIGNRDGLARAFQRSRNNIRAKEEERKRFLLAELERKTEQQNEVLQNSQADPNKSIPPIKERVAVIDSRVTDHTQKISNRGFFERLKFKFVKDGDKELVANLEEEKRLRLVTLGKQESTLRQAEDKFNEDQRLLNDKYAQGVEGVEAEFQPYKKRLLNEVHEANSESKVRIRNTFEAMKHQELNVSSLAQKLNVLVVHSIPPDGWEMRNTSMNNTVEDVTKLSASEKTNIVRDRKPDVSASVIGVGSQRHEKNTMYPLGYIVDGDVVASFDTDVSTITNGDVRTVKGGITLQKDPVEMFKRAAMDPTRFGFNYNEIIVHKPNIKGVLLDVYRLKNKPLINSYPSFEDYSLGEEDEIRKKYSSLQYEGQNIKIEKGIQEFGKYEGQTRIMVSRIPNYLEKAFEFAKTNNPDTPIYLQRQDGIYTLDGKKVNAADIYGGVKA